MIVYAEREREVDTRQALGDLIASIEKDDPESVLIRYGQIESAIADALQPDEDDWTETLEELRFGCILLAMAAGHHGCEFGYDFSRLLTFDLPERIKLRPPEGFAYYSLYPEQYRAAAQKFVDENDPSRCCVIGIRSIGVTLSSV